MADTYADEPTPWRNEDTLRSLYVEEGKTTVEIADRFDITTGTVSDWLDRHDIETNSAEARSADEKPWRDAEKLRRLYHEEKMKAYEIGEKFGVSDATILHWMRKHDIDRRAPGDIGVKPSKEELKDKYGKENRAHHLAAEYGVCTRSVLNWLEEYNIDKFRRGMAVGKDLGGETKGSRYGKYWTEQRKRAIKRDGEECVKCGMGREKHKQEFGYDIHVHHLEEVSEFVDENGDVEREEAHSLDNLITLCAVCHRGFENIPLDVRHLL